MLIENKTLYYNNMKIIIIILNIFFSLLFIYNIFIRLNIIEGNTNKDLSIVENKIKINKNNIDYLNKNKKKLKTLGTKIESIENDVKLNRQGIIDVSKKTSNTIKDEMGADPEETAKNPPEISGLSLDETAQAKAMV
tara:strand:+ start:951 stop:1361 length:411 start_codon:yes stop_codon:yes gene_type:complete